MGGPADVDATHHYQSIEQKTPSLLTVILDTNPRAWAALSQTLPLSKAIGNILLFLNAHISYNSDNQVAVIASHTTHATWLYPSPTPSRSSDSNGDNSKTNNDVEMTDGDGPLTTSPNKYTPFYQVEAAVLSSLRSLNDATSSDALLSTNTRMSGALSLALAYTSKINKALISSKAGVDAANPGNKAPGTAASGGANVAHHSLHARILVVSVSDAAPAQYIPTINAVFAAAYAGVIIDVLALRGDPGTPAAAELNGSVSNGNGTLDQHTTSTEGTGKTTFLQQAAFLTKGTYLTVPRTLDTVGLSSLLMFGFADAEARFALVAPTQEGVDFRAACFCHRRVIDNGFVCSICLSIFCEIPGSSCLSAGTPGLQDGAATPVPREASGGGGRAEIPHGYDPAGSVACPTCESKLSLRFYGDKPAVIPRRKRKRKRAVNGNGREESGSVAGTPRPG